METAMASRKPGFPAASVAVVAGAVALAFSLSAVAQTASKLDDPTAPLREAARTMQRNDLLALYRQALDNDSQYAAAKAQYLATLEREPQARSALLPNLNLLGRANQYTYDISPQDLSNNFGDYGGGLSLTVPVYRPQNWESLEQAKLVVLQGESVLAQARQDLALRLASAYFNVLAARDQITALEVQREATLQQLAQAKREFEVGTKTIVDQNEAQARYDQIVAALQVAVGTLLVRRNELTAIVGRDPQVLAELADVPKLELPQPNEIANWVRGAEDSNYGVQIARANSEIATREIQRAKDGYKPTVDLVAGYNINRFNGTQTTDSSFRTNTGNIGLQLTMPLYTGGLTQSRVREAVALQDKSLSDLETSRRSAANAARAAFTGVNYGLAEVQALESAERSARTQLESTQLGYRVGVRILLDVLNATTQLVSTQRDLKKARYTFLLSGLSLKASVGALSEDDLRAVNALLTK
jgi:outer membrane protein